MYKFKLNVLHKKPTLLVTLRRVLLALPGAHLSLMVLQSFRHTQVFVKTEQIILEH